MLDLELNIKIQATKPSEPELAEAFAVALEAYAAALRQGGIPKQLPIRGTDVNAIMEVQATTSYINSIERGVQSDIGKAKAKLANPNLTPNERSMWEQMLADLEETLSNMQTGETGESAIRMYDLGPKGFDPSWP